MGAVEIRKKFGGIHVNSILVLLIISIILCLPLPTHAVTPIPDYDFDKNFGNLTGANFSIPALAEVLPLTFTDVMGTFFWGLFFMMVFVVMWIRQDDVTNVSIIGMISSGVILAMLPAAWHPAANALAVISFAGLLVSWIYKK